MILAVEMKWNEMKWVYSLKWGLFTWPNQDNQMNMTENGEHDQKIDNTEHNYVCRCRAAF